MPGVIMMNTLCVYPKYVHHNVQLRGIPLKQGRLHAGNSNHIACHPLVIRTF